MSINGLTDERSAAGIWVSAVHSLDRLSGTPLFLPISLVITVVLLSFKNSRTQMNFEGLPPFFSKLNLVLSAAVDNKYIFPCFS
jgi:hypothetical protein